jgi:hypothetical protein
MTPSLWPILEMTEFKFWEKMENFNNLLVERFKKVKFEKLRILKLIFVKNSVLKTPKMP